MGFPSFNALRLAKTFVTEPAQRHCCYELFKKTGLPQTTVWNTLHVLQDKNWIEGKEQLADPDGPKEPRRVMYQITEYGLNAARESLAILQFSSTAYLSP